MPVGMFCCEGRRDAADAAISLEQVYICRSGSAADTQNLSSYVQYFIAQHEMETGEDVEVGLWF